MTFYKVENLSENPSHPPFSPREPPAQVRFRVADNDEEGAEPCRSTDSSQDIANPSVNFRGANVSSATQLFVQFWNIPSANTSLPVTAKDGRRVSQVAEWPASVFSGTTDSYRYRLPCFSARDNSSARSFDY